jgi:mRNA deadenylase 3'-5' endonuclease subunit Ccr4
LDITYNHRCTGLDRDNVAHILQLKDIASGRVLFVGNTHLLFNPKRGDVKLGQIGLLFANLQQQIEKFMSTNSSASFGGYFMCGDFNLEPLSPLYRFVVERKIDLSGYSSAALGRSPLQNNYVQQGGSFNMGNYRFPSESNLKEDCTFRDPNHPPCKSCRQVRHMFNVVSAYDHFRPDHAIEVSTYHADTGNPDFIFYSVVNKLPTQFDHCLEVHEGPLRLVRRLKLPSLPELQRVCGPLPNEQSGSDHLPLLAVFELA